MTHMSDKKPADGRQDRVLGPVAPGARARKNPMIIVAASESSQASILRSRYPVA